MDEPQIHIAGLIELLFDVGLPVCERIQVPRSVCLRQHAGRLVDNENVIIQVYWVHGVLPKLLGPKISELD